MLGLIIEQADGHHRRRDWRAFAAACEYFRCLAAGEIWDGAEPLSDPHAWDI
jgi:hypothetical protein